MVRSVTETESPWNEDQHEMLAALQLYESDIGPHGHLMSRATDPESDANNKKRKRHYVTEHVVDFAARSLSEAQQAMKEKHPKTDLSYISWRVHEVKD